VLIKIEISVKFTAALCTRLITLMVIRMMMRVYRGRIL